MCLQNAPMQICRSLSERNFSVPGGPYWNHSVLWRYLITQLEMSYKRKSSISYFQNLNEAWFCFWTSRNISRSILLSIKAGNVVPDHSPEYYFSEKPSFWNQHSLIYQTSGKETYQWCIIWWRVAVLINTCFADNSFYWRRRKSAGKKRSYMILIVYSLKYLCCVSHSFFWLWKQVLQL